MNPNFGAPSDDIERLAHKWLSANVGLEGETVMRSLAELIKHVVTLLEQGRQLQEKAGDGEAGSRPS